MRMFITAAAVACTLVVALVSSAARAQGVNGTEAQVLREEILRLNERLNRLEQAGQPRVAPAAAPAPLPPALPIAPAPQSPAPSIAPAPGSPPAVATPPTPAIPAGLVAAQAPPPTPGEKEVDFRDHPLNLMGLPKPEVGGFRFFGFFVASANYNSQIQIVPEFAGGAEAKSAPGALNFRFDKFGLGVSKVFADWLWASAAMEVESHADAHSHLIDATTTTRFGCPPGTACERFGAETPATEAVLDRFNLTVVAPLGNGVPISFARFDMPFGFERHDEVLNLTATTSEVFKFGRPQRGTGFNVAYQFTPWLDAQGWVVNRWENETTHDAFDDNNKDKSWGGRVGFTPISRDGILNFGIGTFWGPEQANNNSEPRWIIDGDITWQPNRRLLFAGEVVYGHEQKVSTRQVGIPVAEPGRRADRSWFGFYATGYYEPVNWLGLVARYGFFNDIDGSRTGVEQVLQSITVAPIFHLSRLVPGLNPTGAFFTRSLVPIDWVNVKLEYRYNWSDRQAFSNKAPNNAILNGSTSSNQVQLQVNVNF